MDDDRYLETFDHEREHDLEQEEHEREQELERQRAHGDVFDLRSPCPNCGSYGHFLHNCPDAARRHANEG